MNFIAFSSHRKNPIWQLSLDQLDPELNSIIQLLQQRLCYPQYLPKDTPLKLTPSHYFSTKHTQNDMCFGIISSDKNSQSSLLEKIINTIEYFCGDPLNEEAFESQQLVEAIVRSAIQGGRNASLIQTVRKAVPSCKPASNSLSISVHEIHHFAFKLAADHLDSVYWGVEGKVMVHNPLANDLKLSIHPTHPLYFPSGNEKANGAFDLPLGKYELARYNFLANDPPLLLSVKSEELDKDWTLWRINARWTAIPSSAKINKCQIRIPLPPAQPCSIYGIKMDPPSLVHRAIFDLDTPPSLVWEFGHLVSNTEFSISFKIPKDTFLKGVGKIVIDIEGGALSGQDLASKGLKIWQSSSGISAEPNLEISYHSTTDPALSNIHITYM